MPFDVNGAINEGYTPAQVADFLAKNPADSPIDVAGARKEGYNDDQIVGLVNRPSAWNMLKHDVNEAASPALSGAANTLTALNALGVVPGGKTAGDWIRNNLVDQDAVNHTGLQKAGEAWRQGNYLNAAGDLGMGVLQNIPQLAFTAAGALGGAPGVAAAGSLAYGGDATMQRAANNGRPGNPNWKDALAGMGGEAVLNAIPGFGGPVSGIIDRQGLKLLDRGGQLAFRGGAADAANQAIKHGASDALQSAGSQLVGSVGTDKGAQVDLGQMGESALMGGLTRGALGVAGKLAGAKPSDQAQQAAIKKTGADFQNLAPDQQADALSDAQNKVAAADALKAVQGNAVGKTAEDIPPSVAARKAADNQAADLTGLVKKLDDAGAMADGDAETMQKLVSIARNSQRPLEKSDLEKIDDLGVPDPTKQLFRDMLTQINTLSDAGIMKRGESRLESGFGFLGDKLGHVIGGGPVLGRAVSSFTGPLARSWGAGIADRLGLTKPTLINQSLNAMNLLKAVGIDPTTISTPARLAEATSAANDMLASQRALFAQKPTPDDVALANYMNRDMDMQAKAKAAAQAKADAKDVQKQAESRLAAQQFTNQVKLAAEGMSPPPNPQVGDTAIAAAMARAALDAQGVRKLADQGADMRDRLAMGLPASDPVPVNTPLDAQGRPIQVATPPAVAQAQNRATLNKIIANTLPHEPASDAGPSANPSSLEAALRAPAPVPEGFSHEAALKGQLLPEWMYGLGRNLQDELHLAGRARTVDHAMEVLNAVRELRDQGAFGDPAGAGHEFATNMLNHNGRVVRGVYNLVRNQMLLNNGIDRQSPAARGLTLGPPQ